MIEVYMCCFDPEDSRDGEIVETFEKWENAMLFVDAYREKYKEQMEAENWGIMAYDTVNGGDY